MTAGAGWPQTSVEHPKAGLVFTLGVIAVSVLGVGVMGVALTANTTVAWIAFMVAPAAFVAPLVLGIIAWVIAAGCRREIKAGAQYLWAGRLRTGYILALIATIASLVVAALLVVMLVGALLFWATF